MKQVKLFIYLFIAGVMVAACNKDEAVTMRWDLTGCSNPWDSQITSRYIYYRRLSSRDLRLSIVRKYSSELYFFRI